MVAGEPSLSDVSGLLSQDEVVVLLAALYKEVFAGNEVGRGDRTVGSSELFLVERHAAALHQLTHLALTGEDMNVGLREKVYGRKAQGISRKDVMGHTFENFE